LPAGDREDPPATLVPHLRQHGPRDEERGTIVEVEHFLQRRVVSLVDAGSARESSHHMYERIDPPEAGDDVCGEFPGRVAAGKLRRHGEEFGVREVCRLNGTGNANHPCAGSEERFHHDCSKTSLGAGHECDLAFE
jgi:hypothetical protein